MHKRNTLRMHRRASTSYRGTSGYRYKRNLFDTIDHERKMPEHGFTGCDEATQAN